MGWGSIRQWAAALALGCLAACVATPGGDTPPPRLPSAGATIVLVEPRVSLGILRVAGETQARPDWSDAARAHITTAAREILAGKQRAASLLARADASARVRQVLLLHDAVRVSINTAEDTDPELHTMSRKRAWTLGPGARVLDNTGVATHALIISCDGDFTSAARAVFVVGAAAAGVLAPTGLQRASAVLVDLDTGDIVWRSRVVARPDQDVREAGGARALVAMLLQGAPL